jgi:hypothetical protein
MTAIIAFIGAPSTLIVVHIVQVSAPGILIVSIVHISPIDIALSMVRSLFFKFKGSSSSPARSPPWAAAAADPSGPGQRSPGPPRPPAGLTTKDVD